METVALGGRWTTVAAELELEVPVGDVYKNVVTGCDLRVGEQSKAIKPEWLSSKAGMGQPGDRRHSGGESRVKEPIGEVEDGWRSFWRSPGRSEEEGSSGNGQHERLRKSWRLATRDWSVAAGPRENCRRSGGQSVCIVYVLCPETNKK